MKLLSALAAICLLSSQVSAGVLGHWPLDDGSGSIARNTVPDAGDGFIGAPGIITNAETGGAHPTEPDGLASVWSTATDFPLGERVVWSTGGQGCRGCPNTFNADENPNGLRPSDTAFVEAGRVPKMDTQNEFTWVFWAKTDEKIASRPGQFSGIVGNRYGDQDPDTPGREAPIPLQFIKFTPDGMEYYYDGANPNIPYSVDEAGEPTDMNHIPEGEWHHHAMVKSGGDSPTFSYYRNGELFNTAPVGAEGMDSDFPFFLGGDDAFDDAEQWHGFLSDVAIFDEALSQDAVRGIVAGAAIPEPTTFTLTLLGMLLAFVPFRRKR